jgi:hypothetical protein
MNIILAASVLAMMASTPPPDRSVKVESSTSIRFHQMIDAGINAVRGRLSHPEKAGLRNIAIHKGRRPSSGFGSRVVCGDIAAKDPSSATQVTPFMTVVFWDNHLERPFAFDPVLGENAFYAQLIAHSCIS